MDTELLGRTARIEVRNVGGIDETAVEFDPGITVLTGRNATNRTSLLRSIMAVMGSDDASLKADADDGRVELTVGGDAGERYVRTFTRTNGAVSTGGEPFLDDPELADLFAFLLESNEVRRSVARSEDLRELIMRPIDTDAIRAEIRELEREKSRIDDDLSALDDLKGDLPQLERERNRLETDIEEKRAELAAKEDEIETLDADLDETRAEQRELESRLDDLREKRSELERVRSDIDLQQDSIESLTAERRELEAERDDLPDAPMGDHADIDEEIERLRERIETLEREVSDLQDVIQFNENQLDETGSVTAHLDEGGTPTDALVDETVACWTCGSTVETERITSTLDQLRDVRREKLETTRTLESELSQLKEEQRKYQKQQQRKESLDRQLDDIAVELEDRETQLDSLREERERLNADVEELESEIETLESDDFDGILDLHKEANQLEFELGRLESDLDDVIERIGDVEERLAEEDQLRSQREEIDTELRNLRTRIDRIEANAVEQFNDHMGSVLDILGYDNLERIWIERVERTVQEGRRNVQKTLFELHIVRSTDSGATFEDTIDHLSESEREVTGLVFALAGYLVHDVHETVPFVLLDSLEAIDSERIAALTEYVAEYAEFLVVALLPEDAQALDDTHTRVTEI
ncbi:archaea-specific SMC-related protein [Haloplanus salilacus]|uniref:archaea-specific SMC-related protein n=1 Tax=Haloplanus salilacus TaxID=2949994 RepID=UPI0030D3F35C